MTDRDVCIIDYDLVTPFGDGVTPFVDGVLAGRRAIAPVTRFDTSLFPSHGAGCVSGLSYREGTSLVMGMAERLAKGHRIPSCGMMIFASTVGEIDLMETETAGSTRGAPPLIDTACTLRARFGVAGRTEVVSAACASTLFACARAKAMIGAGEAEVVTVIAADAVSEFVFSGFSSLLALDPSGARPFDVSRAGLTPGEAIGYIVFASRAYASKNGCAVKAVVAGCGMSNDASHMTCPSSEGRGLAAAMRKALVPVDPSQVSMIAAHGTGTVHNDAAELRAFAAVFPAPIPVFSLKGAVGHTMANAGLLQLVALCESLRSGVIPGTVGLSEPDPLGAGWVSSRNRTLNADLPYAMAVNAGFGGVNAVALLRKEDGRHA